MARPRDSSNPAKETTPRLCPRAPTANESAPLTPTTPDLRLDSGPRRDKPQNFVGRRGPHRKHRGQLGRCGRPPTRQHGSPSDFRPVATTSYGRLDSISGRQLSRAETPLANGAGQRGAAGLASAVLKPMRMRSVGERGGSANGKLLRAGRTQRRRGVVRRVRFSRAAATVEDVGYALSGGGAGLECIARQLGAAARRLRRCGVPGSGFHGLPDYRVDGSGHQSLRVRGGRAWKSLVR